MADDGEHQPKPKGSPSATKQGGSQPEASAADLPMRAIQAAEELAKALKPFPPTLGKE